MYHCRPFPRIHLAPLFSDIQCSRLRLVPSNAQQLYSLFVNMGTALLVFIASHFECLATIIFISCFLPIIELFRKKRQAQISREHERTDVPQVNKKAIPKKPRKRGNPKKKKSRGNCSSKHQNKENMGENSERSGQKQNVATEEADKQKSRKWNALTVKPAPTTYVSQNKSVKFYSPLNIYVQLQMDAPELYLRFQPYVLKMEDLEINGFPLFADDQSGKVTFAKSRYKYNVESENPHERWCCRCGEKYIVSEDGLYQAETICSYHSGRRHGAGPFSCCGHYVPEGCVKNKHHVSATTTLKSVSYVKTKHKRQAQVPPQIYSLDCEMCYTVQGLEVTRVSLVGTDGLSVYDSFVLPESPVVDYNTCYSGITANHLKDVKTTLADVQAFLLKHLNSRTILVGHGLENDLKALRIVHEAIIDTSVVFPHHFGYPYKRSLKSLATSFLKQKIQEGDQGHDSVEDARTCMELMLWKVQSDRQVCAQTQQRLVVPAPQQWAVSPIAIHPAAVVPYNVGYWVPPVGSSCDLY